MKRYLYRELTFAFIFLFQSGFSQGVEMPLPEHPRPDFQREEWINLNGLWEFQFDMNDTGEEENWQQIDHQFGM